LDCVATDFLQWSLTLHIGDRSYQTCQRKQILEYKPPGLRRHEWAEV
jgi:hypothetical protein